MSIPPDLLRKIHRIEIKTRRLVDHILGGQYNSLFKGTGLEFDEVRPYQEGDDDRRIDWNVSARMGQLHIKRFVEERELSLLFVTDISPSIYFGSRQQLKSDQIIEFCALMAFSAMRNNDRVGLLTFQHHPQLFLPPRKGDRHALRLIRELVIAYQEPPQTQPSRLENALAYLNRVLHRRSVVFIVSDFIEIGSLHTLRTLGKKHDCIAVMLRDPRDVALPPLGLVELRHPETGQTQIVDLSNPHRRHLFETEINHYYQQLFNDLNRMSIDQIILETPGSVVKALIHFFGCHHR